MTGQPLRYLLVEDDDDHAKIVARTLSREAIANEIERVRDGVEALQFLRKEGPFATAEPPDVILLDLKLPKKDGLEVLDEIKSDTILRTIPVVVLSTSDAEVDKMKAYQSYANSYLVKPMDPGKFKQMVQELNLYWGNWNRPPLRQYYDNKQKYVSKLPPDPSH